jgi:hypothetical protein
MLYPNESPFIMDNEPYVDVLEIEDEIKQQFSNAFGNDIVIKIHAGEYPSIISVLLYLKNPEAQGVKDLKRKIENDYAAKKLRVSIAILDN